MLLLCAFAGGCLSAAIVLGVWRAESVAALPAQQQLARSNELLAAAIAARNAEQRRDAPDHTEHASANAADREAARGNDAKSNPSLSKGGEDSASAEPAPAGSAVADVLTDLEAAYRKRMVATAPAEGAAAPAPATEPAAPAPASDSAASAPAEPKRELPAPSVVAVAPVLPVAPAAPVSAAPASDAPAVAPPAASPAVVAQNDVRPVDIHYGDVNQNTYVTNVRQGDTYVVQQQIALLQYMQLLGMSPGARLGRPARTAGRGTGARFGAPSAAEYKQFPSTLTNPDNPWGFNFAPPNLVH